MKRKTKNFVLRQWKNKSLFVVVVVVFFFWIQNLFYKNKIQQKKRRINFFVDNLSFLLTIYQNEWMIILSDLLPWLMMMMMTMTAYGY